MVDLEKIEKRFFYCSPDPLCLVNEIGCIKMVNPAFEEIAGFTARELEGQPFLSFILPQDAASAEEFLNANDVRSIRSRFRNKNNEYSWFDWAKSAVDASGDIFIRGQNIAAVVTLERRFNSFYKNVQIFMCEHDLDGKFITVNTVGAAALGASVAEMEQLGLFDIVPEKYHQDLQAYLDRIRSEGHVKGLMHVQHKDGTKKVWLYNNVVEKKADGEAFVIGSAIDITDRVNLEMDLKQTKLMLEQTNAVARIGYWQMDALTLEIYWSDLTRQIHEVPADFTPDLHTGISFFKEGESRDKINQAVEEAIKYGRSYDLELEMITYHGTTKWVRAIGNAELENGVSVRLYGTYQDIDEQKKISIEIKESRNLLAAFVEHEPAAVAMFDHDMNYIAYSNAWVDLFQLQGKSLIGKSHYKFFPALPMEWKAIYDRCLKGAVICKEEDIWHVPGRAQELYMRWEIRPWMSYDGKIGGIMIFTEDITEEVTIREELRVAKQQAEEGSKAKSSFLANMSHEIRTPLNGIIGYSDLLLKSGLNHNQKEYMSIVNESGKALLNIINDILDFSKIEANKLELDIQRFSLLQMVVEVSDIVRFQLEEKGITMWLQFSPSLPTHIWVDSVRLKQILINLMVNAIKFTSEGFIELRISLITPNTQGDVVIRFEVIDTGIGIHPSLQQKIFEAFSQADQSITRKFGGTGLGLNISNRLLLLMQSKLCLKSSPGNGSVFSFDLPVKAELALEGEDNAFLPVGRFNHLAMQQFVKREHKAAPMENSPLTSLKSANIHVLLAEDNHVNRLLAKTILKRILPNARITEAINGQIAVDAVMKDKPDLVLMDIQMPELNGYEATARIREIYGSKIPILALTAGNVLGEREKCLAAGMDDFLAKPFVEDALRDMLEKWSPVIVTQPSVVDKEHFDEAVLMAFVNMGKPDPALLDQVIEASLMDLRALEADMQIMDGLKEKYKGLGHKIYGIAASLGFKKLARLSREMEDSSGAMDELERLYRAILEELQLCIQTFEHYR